MATPEYFVHESAYVDEGAIIGKGTKIWHFSHVLPGAQIGEGVSIGQNVNVGGKAKIGNRCKIQNNISVYDDVELEDEVFAGPSMVFTNVFNPRAFIVRKHEYRKTLVRRGATLGANSTIVCGHTIGRYAFIGAGAVVNVDVPDFAMMVGVPAKQKGWMCKCAISLNFVGGKAVCAACGGKYVLENGLVREA
jgi:UDP-2-acetamido-3-amino-2,3-dideoxy-glucuronate N-acetyltransferase